MLILRALRRGLLWAFVTTLFSVTLGLTSIWIYLIGKFIYQAVLPIYGEGGYIVAIFAVVVYIFALIGFFLGFAAALPQGKVSKVERSRSASPSAS